MYLRFIAILAIITLSTHAHSETRVTTARLGELLQPQIFSAPATVESLNTAHISAETNGLISDIPVRIGETVKTGDLLIELDCRLNQSRLNAQQASKAQLRARRVLAVNQLKRARNLKSGRTISQDDIEQRESEVAALNAQIKAQEEAIQQARLETERCQISAPFEGVITERLASVGSLAGPGTPLLEMVQIRDAEVSSQLRPDQAAAFTENTEASFIYLSERYTLELRQLLPVVDSRTRTREIRFQFSDKSAPVGAAGRLEWQQSQALLPADYVIRRDGKLGLFLLGSDKARFHPLPAALEGQPVNVDLPADTQVIVSGRQRIQDGEAVTVSRSGK